MVGSQRPSPISAKVLNCPSCGAPVTIRAQGHTVIAICGACNTQLDASTDVLKILNKLRHKKKRQQMIELGRRGKIHGVTWEAIGYLERSDESGLYMWSEYLLFNPTRGFRWLTEFNGHWNYVVMTKNKPEIAKPGSSTDYAVKYLDKYYHLFHTGKAKVVFVLGEFHWQIKEHETVTVHDYINPPEMLSHEGDKTEAVWSLAEYITAEQVKKGFDIKEPMPLQLGVAPNQPSTLKSVSNGSLGLFGIFLAILVVAQLFFLISADRKELFKEAYMYDPADPVKLKVTPQFEITKSLTNLEIRLETQLRNGWLSVSADLINDDTGQSMEFEHGAEVYSGFDSDGSWNEGDRNASMVLSKVPAGKYHVNFEVDSRSGPAWNRAQLQEPVSYVMTIRQGVTTWSNFLWAISIISIFPVIFWWRNRSFEVNRWSTSDFSPYFTTGSNDDDDEDY